MVPRVAELFHMHFAAVVAKRSSVHEAIDSLRLGVYHEANYRPSGSKIDGLGET
jgi:hypothetical protein